MVNQNRNRISLFPLGALLLATPQALNAAVDPGLTTMLWQLAAASVIGGFFFARQILEYLRNRFGPNSHLAAGFLFATAYSLISIPVILIVFGGQALPRFNDVFLVGIVLTAYLFRWEPSAYLLGIALLVSAWILPPQGSFRVAGAEEWYRMLSFAVVAVFLVHLVNRSKSRRLNDETSPASFAVRSAAVGD